MSCRTASCAEGDHFVVCVPVGAGLIARILPFVRD
jgi:hypothetical protein